MDYHSMQRFLHTHNIIAGRDYIPNGTNYEFVKVPKGLLETVNGGFLKAGWYIIEKGIDAADNDYIRLSMYPAKIIRVKVTIISDGTSATWYKTDDVFIVSTAKGNKLYEVIEPEHAKGKTIPADHVDALELIEL